MDNKAPELLDNGGVIARRILELPDRSADMGAMYLRHLLWRVHEEVGDGTATTAVLFQAIYNAGGRYVVAGGNPMMLRRHLEAGLQLILAELNRVTLPLAGQEKLVQMAESVCYEPFLAKTLGEIFDHIGEYGRLETRSGGGREIKREYMEGSYWDSKRFSNQMQSDTLANTRVELLDASILISDIDIEDPQELSAFLVMAQKAGLSNLVIVANSLSEVALAMLHRVNQKSGTLKVIVAKTPGTATTDQPAFLEDIAILTGGRPLLKVAGDSLSGVTPEDFGAARRVWADRNHLGLVRGQGDARQIRTQLQKLRRILAKTSEPAQRRKFQLRIGQLLGGAAVLWLGAATETEMDTRQALAKRTANALRGAMREGVVPGGGVALLAGQPALQQRLEQATNADERAAYRILHTALEAPARALVSNAGYEASAVIGKLTRNGTGFGFDVTSGEVVNMVEAGIWDSAAVVKAAVEVAVSGAALALTTDVLIHHKTPQQAVEP
jgi:chaperonin GroEL